MVTDHQPLTSIFNPAKGIPTTTASRMVRYAVFLASFDYNIEYKNTTKHCNADGLSRVPLPDVGRQAADPDDLLHLSQFDTLPVTSAQIRKETIRDVVLAIVYEYTMKG